MFKRFVQISAREPARRWAGFPLALFFLIIVFYDELSYAVGGAALPSLRTDLGLTYAQVGLLLGLPQVANTFLEPALMLLGDTRLRKSLMVAGGVAITVSAFLIASAASFPAVLAGFVLALPASGAFVSLSQATLMDMNPGREPQAMARWSVAGSLGNLIGPLLLAGGFALEWGWRWAYFCLALGGLVLAGLLLPRPIPTHPGRKAVSGGAVTVAGDLLRGLGANLRNLSLLRWILLSITADLLMDVFTSYLPLYFTDVVGFTAAQASLVLSAYILVGLLNGLALIPILERWPGRRVVRLSAAVCLPLYAAWLLVPWPAAKVALALAIALAVMGWYAVISGEVFAASNGRSGTVMAIGSLAAFLGGFQFWLVGWAANTLGLQAAMWLLILGPVSLILGVPRAEK